MKKKQLPVEKLLLPSGHVVTSQRNAVLSLAKIHMATRHRTHFNRSQPTS